MLWLLCRHGAYALWSDLGIHGVATLVQADTLGNPNVVELPVTKVLERSIIGATHLTVTPVVVHVTLK